MLAGREDPCHRLGCLHRGRGGFEPAATAAGRRVDVRSGTPNTRRIIKVFSTTKNKRRLMKLPRILLAMAVLVFAMIFGSYAAPAFPSADRDTHVKADKSVTV